MQLENAAKMLKELGHPTRLAIFRQVVRAGHEGVAVGKLQEQLAIPGSTLSHHISSLVSAQLMTQRRESRTLYCTAEYDHFHDLIGYLRDECCADEKG